MAISIYQADLMTYFSNMSLTNMKLKTLILNLVSNKYNVAMKPGIKIDKSNKSKVKNLAN